MIERTLLLVKPDGIKRAVVGKVITRLEDSGLKLVAIKMVVPDKQLAGTHYMADKKWFEDTGNKSLKAYKEKGIPIKGTAVQIATSIRNYLIDFLSSGPVIAMVIEGNCAISITRKIVGATEPQRSDPSTIRGAYASDSYDAADVEKRPIMNIVHASEDNVTADREIKVWFRPGEILKYKRIDQDAIY